MLLAIASWIVAGIVVSALTNGARWGLANHNVTVPRPLLLTVGVGVAGALFGAIVGTVLVGPPFALAAGIFLGGIASIGGPLLMEVVQQRRVLAAKTREGDESAGQG
jgi:hypothetical protein